MGRAGKVRHEGMLVQVTGINNHPKMPSSGINNHPKKPRMPLGFLWEMAGAGHGGHKFLSVSVELWQPHSRPAVTHPTPKDGRGLYTNSVGTFINH